MSDEQWLWLFVHQRIDADEKLEKMCPKCREEVTSDHKCIRCGKDIIEQETFVNPNFDIEKYNRLAGIIDDDMESEDDCVEEMEDRSGLADDEFYYDDEDERCKGDRSYG